MTYLARLALILSLCLVGLAPANARDEDFFLASSILYYSNTRSRTSHEEKTFLIYDAKAAYSVVSDLFLGFAYQGETTDTKTSGFASSSLNNTAKGARASMGPTLGYVSRSFHLIFTYYYDSKWNLSTTTSTSTNKYVYSGSGMQLDVSYKIPLGSFSFGPQISYRTFAYSKLKIDGASASSISPKLEETGFEPSLVLFYFF